MRLPTHVSQNLLLVVFVFSLNSCVGTGSYQPFVEVEAEAASCLPIPSYQQVFVYYIFSKNVVTIDKCLKIDLVFLLLDVDAKPKNGGRRF